jgi:hypothetical protein
MSQAALTAEQLAAARQQIAEDVLTGIASTTVDGTRVEAESLGDRLDALRKLEQDAAVRGGGRGFRLSKFRAPGSV